MDPVILALIAAIGAGITSSVTDATKASLVASYTALKTHLLEKIGSLHPKIPQALTELEAAPTSQARQAILVEEVAPPSFHMILNSCIWHRLSLDKSSRHRPAPRSSIRSRIALFPTPVPRISITFKVINT